MISIFQLLQQTDLPHQCVVSVVATLQMRRVRIFQGTAGVAVRRLKMGGDERHSKDDDIRKSLKLVVAVLVIPL